MYRGTPHYLSVSVSVSISHIRRSFDIDHPHARKLWKKRGKSNNNIQVYQFQWHHIRVFCSCCGLCAFLFCSYANVRTLHSLSKNKLLRISTEKNRGNNKYAIFVTRLSSTHTHTTAAVAAPPPDMYGVCMKWCFRISATPNKFTRVWQ